MVRHNKVSRGSAVRDHNRTVIGSDVCLCWAYAELCVVVHPKVINNADLRIQTKETCGVSVGRAFVASNLPVPEVCGCGRRRGRNDVLVAIAKVCGRDLNRRVCPACHTKGHVRRCVSNAYVTIGALNQQSVLNSEAFNSEVVVKPTVVNYAVNRITRNTGKRGCTSYSHVGCGHVGCGYIG